MSLIFEKVRTILSEKFCFHSDQIQLETKLELELGMDSREILELLNELEITFEIQINLDDIDQLIQEGKTFTIQDIVNYIKEKEFSNFDF
jgi:acyl carrier protein